MTITNNHNLPQPIINALEMVRYKGVSDRFASVTELLNPPWLQALKEKHNDEITEDASESIYQLFGTAFHAIMEKSNPSAGTEKTLVAEINGRKITGTADLYLDRVVYDWKVTSAYTVMHESRIKEWTTQLNIYAWLFEKSGYEVRDLWIIAFIRDWRRSEQLRNGGQYPAKCQPISINKIPSNVVERYINHRMDLLEDARNGRADPCKPSDHWARGETWAVHKDGRKSALRLLPTHSEAESFIDNHTDKSKLRIEHRPAYRVRCEEYCSVSQFCTDFQESKR